MDGQEKAKRVILTVLKNPDLADAVRLFLDAFEVIDLSMAEEVEEYWRLLRKARIARFIGAKHEAKTVGCGALIRYSLSAWIAFMGVRRDMRRKGIGDTIMKRLMSYAAEAGIKTLKLDATNLGKPLYARHGFKEEYRVLRYEISLSSKSDSCKPSGAKLLSSIPQWCVDMDRDAFGDDRSQLFELVVRRGGKVVAMNEKGYGILWKQRVGPVIADNLDTAKAIVRHAYELGAKNMYVPLHKHLPRDFLSDLRQVRSSTSIVCCERMTLGKRLKEDTTKVFASFSPATG